MTSRLLICSMLGLLVAGRSFLAMAEDSDPRMLINGLQLHPLRENADPSSLGVYDTYEEAQQLEAEIVQMYREIRAAELSLIQRQTLDRSLESTLMPLSERAKVDKQVLTQSAQDAEAVKEYQDELGVVMQQTDAIVANANELLARFLQEVAPPPPPETQSQQEQEQEQELTPEQIAALVTQPPPEPQQVQQQEQELQQQQQELQQQQQELQQQVEQELAEVELNLEQALQEIEDAREQVNEEMKELDVAVEEKKTEPEEAEEIKEKLQELSQKVDKASEVVESVVETLKQVTEVPEEQMEKAEQVMQELREALAVVQEMDQTVPETTENPQTKEHTEAAVQQIQSAQTVMQSAATGMAELEKLSQQLAAMGVGATQTLSGDQAIARMQSLEELSHARAGKWLDITAQMRGKNLHAKPVEVPENQHPALWESADTLKKVPISRKITTDGPPGGGWVFLGDWYVLGRYDNANRSNLQKVYPPESILDINAHYVSEDGKPMQWEYESFLPPMIVPTGWESWKIYYFYTEITFEQESEVWLAIGSDDRSDVWINDLPVWHSSNEHKSWRPQEGFRKVVFKQGRNKVLVRLENGQHSLGLSIYMHLGP